MPAFNQPPFRLRHAAPSEASLIADLRLASLLDLEMPNHPLGAVRAVMSGLPDADVALLEAGRYFVAEHDGDLLGGVGWSLMPACFRAETLVGEDGRGARLSIKPGSVLIRGFFLDADLGRRGAGGALLARLEADAGSAGHSVAEIVAPASSQVLYRSLGFRAFEKLGLALGRGAVLPLLHMRKGFSRGLAIAA